jgi:dTDP-glucose pyrophosphorylase
MSKDWREIIIHEDRNVSQALEVIDRGGLKIALVINSEKKLVGTITDGDIRRAFLKGISLGDSLKKVMNSKPISIQGEVNDEEALTVMKKHTIAHLPVIDESGRIIDLKLSDRVLGIKKDNVVALFLGGNGSRLGELTRECPKPMLRIGEKTILENIIHGLTGHGLSNFLFIVNYKNEMIKDFFGNGEQWNVNITYITEEAYLGTAGGLSLITDRPSAPMIVMNGDILTNINYSDLLHFHEAHESIATICLRKYENQIPYGVATFEGTALRTIEEKPTQEFFVSAGIYVLNPEALDYLPNNTYFDMPFLFQQFLKNKRPVTVFPIREFWLDIGNLSDFNRSKTEFFT